MNILAFLMKIFPSVLQGVIAVENAVKAPGQTKKQLVLGAITAAAQAGEAVPEAHVAAIGGLIDNVVGTLNASGVFAPSTPAAK